jgi:hypothetical protein
MGPSKYMKTFPVTNEFTVFLSTRSSTPSEEAENAFF